MSLEIEITIHWCNASFTPDREPMMIVQGSEQHLRNELREETKRTKMRFYMVRKYGVDTYHVWRD